jgi:hypothetical protein
VELIMAKIMRKMTLALPAIAVVLAGCSQGITPNRGGNSIIAKASDAGIVDRGPLRDGEAGIVYDPDGCQAWLIDDGIEGYSGRRFDPVSGLPICNNLYPPGTVLGNYQTDGRSNRSDWVRGRF